MCSDGPSVRGEIGGTVWLIGTPQAKLQLMVDRSVLRDWLIEALSSLGGSASVLDVSKEVWRSHRGDIERSGDLFYTWQYDLRWAATALRKEGLLAMNGRGAPWRLM